MEFEVQSFKKRKSATEDGMLWKQRLKAKQASMKLPLGHSQDSTPTYKGNAQPPKHAAKIRNGPQSSTQRSAPQHCGKPAGQLLKPNKSKKKASPQQEQVC